MKKQLTSGQKSDVNPLGLIAVYLIGISIIVLQLRSLL